MNLRGQRWLMIGVLLVSACRFPPPTRPESNNRDTSSLSVKESTSSNPEGLQKQIQELRADSQSTSEDWDQKIRALQDKIDILEHNFQESQKLNEKIHQDIDQRLINVEKKGSDATLSTSAPASNATTETHKNLVPPTSSTPVGISTEKNIASPIEQQYQTILDSFLEEKNYDKSIKEFKKFMQSNPKDPLAGNAQYWIGEAYYAKADYPKAITEFQKVIDNYSNSSKKCDTLLKQGMAFMNMKDPSNAKLFLKETIDQCAGTTASEKAKKLL